MDKKTVKLEVELKIADPILAKTGYIMGGMDLGIDGIYEVQTISFETSSEINPEYIEALKKTLTEGFEKDGYKVFGIVVKVLS